MATQATTTRRSQRLLGVPACSLDVESTLAEGMPAFPRLESVAFVNPSNGIQYWGKQAHNPVGVTSS